MCTFDYPRPSEATPHTKLWVDVSTLGLVNVSVWVPVPMLFPPPTWSRAVIPVTSWIARTPPKVTLDPTGVTVTDVTPAMAERQEIIAAVRRSPVVVSTWTNCVVYALF